MTDAESSTAPLHPIARARPVPFSAKEIGEALRFALETARASGECIVPHFRRLARVEDKAVEGDWDPVTAADRDAEALIRRRIEERFPEHGILGEEFGLREGNGATWVLDPLDGTRAFVTGFLHWGTLIALYDGRDPVLGVLHQPVTRELFYGDGGSAWYRREESTPEPLATRACAELGEAIIATTHPGCFPEPADWRAFEALASRCRMLRYGGDCYGYAMVAMGQLDLVVEAALNAYDIQALIPIVRGAGGVVTDWRGGNPALGGTVIAAGDTRVHAQALEVLQRSLDGD